MRWVIVPALIVMATAGPPAWASGFQLREQSADAMGNAFAGATARAADPSTLFYNPAGMTRLEGGQAEIDAAWLEPYSRFKGANTVGPQATGGSDGGNHTPGSAVGAGYVVWDAGPDWRVGLAVTAPFGMHSDYNEDWVGRYHALDTKLTNVNISPSIAYRVNDRLSVATGLQVAYTDTLFSNALNFGALVPGSGDGLFRVTADDWGVGWTASALYEVTPDTRVGLAYRSSIRHHIHGKAEFEGVPAALAAGPTFGNSGVSADLTLPDVATFGIFHRISPRWAVMSDVSWTNWSVVETLRLEFDNGRPDQVERQNWHDTWFTSLGVAYTPTEHLSLNMGVAYDMGAIDRDTRSPRLPDSDRVWLSTGLSYSPRPGHRLSLSYAHLFADQASIDQTDPNQIGGRLVGRYDNHVDVIAIGYTVRF